MFRHQRQISLELKPTKNSTAITISHMDTDNLLSYERTLNKKHQRFQPSPFLDTIYLRRQLGRNRKTEVRLPSHHKSPSKLSEKKSVSKLPKQKVIKISPMHMRVQPQQASLNTHGKLVKINAIFNRSFSGETKSILTQLYQKNAEYSQLIRQWERLYIKDEVDSQIYALTQSLLEIVDTAIQSICVETNTRMLQYEDYIQRLSQQNQRLKEIESNFQMLSQVFQPLKAKTLEIDVKNQWGILILNQIERHLDVESYIKTTPIFKRWSEHKLARQDKVSKGNSKESDLFKKTKTEIGNGHNRHNNGTDRQKQYKS